MRFCPQPKTCYLDRVLFAGCGGPSLTVKWLVAPDRRLRILLVDDEPAVAETMKAVLDSVHHVETASSGFEARRILERSQFDVLCTDFKMPGMDGIELLRWVGAQNMTIAAILVTGMKEYFGEDHAQRDLGKLGLPFSVLRKPCPPRQLIEAVEHAGMLAAMRRAAAAASAAAKRIGSHE